MTKNHANTCSGSKTRFVGGCEGAHQLVTNEFTPSRSRFRPSMGAPSCARAYQPRFARYRDHKFRKHIIKQLFLFPGLLVPLLGNAYSRACEASCDRYGAFASEDIDASVNAMMVMSGGKAASKMMNPISFAAQYSKMRGFFVSWYELISGYTTFSQRVAHLLSVKDGRPPSRSPHNPLAYVFAFFTVGGRGTGGANLMITIAIIGLLAVILIPSLEAARVAAQQYACINNLRQMDAAKEQAAFEYAHRDGTAIPEEQVSAFVQGSLDSLRCSKGGIYTINLLGQDPECSVHGSLSSVSQGYQNYRMPNQ